jgi:hypothetical protein
MQEPADFHVGIQVLQKLGQAHEVIVVTPHYIPLLMIYIPTPPNFKIQN